MSVFSVFLAKAELVEHSTVAWIAKEWKVVVQDEPKIEAITDTAVSYIGNALEIGLAFTGDAALSNEVASIVTAIHSKLISANALVSDFGATTTAAGAFADVQSNLSQIDTLLGVKSTASQAAISKAVAEAGNLTSAISAAASAIATAASTGTTVLPVIGTIPTVPTATEPPVTPAP